MSETARPIPAGLVRRWKNPARYHNRRTVPGTWHAYDVRDDSDDRYLQDHNVRPETALCGRVDERFLWYGTAADPLDMVRMPKFWRKVCLKCSDLAGQPRPVTPTPKEEPMPEPTPEPEVTEPQVEYITVADMPRILSERSLYLAIATALLDNEAEAIQFLRGQARIGLLAGPDGPTADEKDHDLHRMVMAALERLGVEPITEEELHIEMRAAAQSASTALAKLGVTLGPDGRPGLMTREGPKPN